MKANTYMSGIHGEADFGNLQSIVEDKPFGGVDFTRTLGASYGFAEMGNVDYTPMSGIDMGIPEGLGAFDVVEHIKKNKNLIMAAVAIAAAYWYFRKRK